jgi:hypothetical protein
MKLFLFQNVIERQSATATTGEITLFDSGDIDILRIYATFMDSDEDRSGKIDKHELSKLITRLTETEKGSKSKKKHKETSKRHVDKLWAKLDADKTGSATWFEFLESVGDGDFHELGLEHIFHGKGATGGDEMFAMHQKALAASFTARVRTEAANEELFEEIEKSLMVEDTTKKRNTPTMHSLTQQQVGSSVIVTFY